jgi:hypothetical protein
MICPTIDNPASFKMRAVIHFIHVKNMSAAHMYYELCAVYRQNVMNEGTIRQWYGMFKNWPTDIHDEERSGWPSVMCDDLVQSVDQKNL